MACEPTPQSRGGIGTARSARLADGLASFQAPSARANTGTTSRWSCGWNGPVLSQRLRPDQSPPAFASTPASATITAIDCHAEVGGGGLFRRTVPDHLADL